MPPPLPALAHHALAAYAEPLVGRRRVVLFGGDGSFADRLGEMGAEDVTHVLSASEASDLRAASFDLALAPDLGALAEPARVVAEARRLVGAAGVALFAAGNRDVENALGERTFDYYELFDCVAASFADVRMIAEVPFRGVALAELGNEDESPAVSVDTQLVDEGQSPVAFVALASERGASLDPYAIYELPSEPAPEPAPERDDAELLAPLQSELAREKVRVDGLLAQLEGLRPQVARVQELEREALAREGSLVALASEVEAIRASATASAEVASQVEALARRAEQAEAALARSGPSADEAAAELTRLEATLAERAALIRDLEAEVARRDRLVRDLVATVEEQAGAAPSGPTGPEPWLEENARLRARLDAMALELARREGEAQASMWGKDERARRQGEPTEAAPASRALQDQLNAAMDEVDALRRALTQEHEERVRAEGKSLSGR